jgi:uncharacterized protein (UPF0248 family)
MQTRVRIFLLGSFIIFALLGLHCRPSSQEIDPKEVSELEEYLLDFSKKIEGHRLQTGSLPLDLDAKKFFSILEKYYPDQRILKIVKKYPVRISREGESYILILCDKGSTMALYKDLGSTITHVDFPYYREGQKVPCHE